jgi:hypothetical protein
MIDDLPVTDGKELDRLIACVLVAEPTAYVGRVWRLVPESRVLKGPALSERIEAQRPRAEKVRTWLAASRKA